MTSISFSQLAKRLKGEPVFMMIGHGAKNQFQSIQRLKNVVGKISTIIPPKSVFLYFGDAPNKEKPDIGYAFQLLTEKNKEIQIYMIQISEAKNWGLPPFVNYVHWHRDFKENCKWGGVDEKGIPCSNTKKWYQLGKEYINIQGAFVLGGGPITLKEIELLISLSIPIYFFPMKRKFLGDGKTLVNKKASVEEIYGPTYIYNKRKLK